LAISSDVAELKDMVRALLLDKKNQSSAPAPSSTPALVKAVESNCVMCGGTHSYQNCPATSGNIYQDNIQEYVSQAAAANYNQGNIGFRPQMVANQFQPPGIPPEDLNGITTRSGVAYQGPTIPTPSKVVKQASVSEPIAAPVSAPMPNLKPSIPYPSRRDNERRCDQANEQIEKFYKIFKDMSFKISFTNALILMPKFASTLKALIGNKKKLSEMARTLMNEHCSTVILKNPTPSDDPIVSTTSPTLTPFRDIDFLLFEEANAFLGLEDDPDSLELDPSYYDPERDIQMLEDILNSDPAPSLPDHEQSTPSFKNELMACEAKTIKSSVDEPLEVELKDLPPHLEYAFLEGDNKLPVIIAKELGDKEKAAKIKVLKFHKRAIGWKLSDIQEVEKLLDVGLIYPISDSPWVSPVHCVPKKGGFTIVKNEENEFIPTRLVTGWRVCIDYRKLNEATRKDHFPLPFMDQMLERLAGNEYYCFLDGFSGYFQIFIDPRDQEKTTFTCPYGTFAYRRMPFGLCNAPGTFQRCMLAIFHDMVEKTMEVFMDDFSVFGNSFETCLSRLDKMLQSCEDTKLCLNWEKSHFMIKEGIVLGHKISRNGIEVDKAKVDVHCVPKKGGFTVVENEENELIPTRLVTGWQVCIDYRKLNEATRKDHFPLPFMDQMLERLAGNEYYCFLDGFSGYF
nr:reverse transcriptase domain-containing protein [Tanacetum cinerariifolium]